MNNTDNHQNGKQSTLKKQVTQIDFDKIASPDQEETSGKPTADDLAGPDFIPVGSGFMTHTSKDKKNIKWSLIIPALAVILCLGLFSVASYAGWIQTFLTPDEKLVKVTTEEETTTTEEETTTKEPETTTETTTEETTTEFIPSYYIIDVNLAYNVVTVYTRGEKYSDGWDPDDPLDDLYDRTPAIAFVCSPGVDGATPTGRFYLQERAAWCLMIGDVYTQYATRIQDDVMFHSIPYYTQNPGDIETEQYNILGYNASSACVRLNARDAFWIFNNCAYGTEVNIFYDWDNYSPITPEPIYTIPTDIAQLKGWDPTDIWSAGNPWLYYSAFLSYDTVELPQYSSVNTLLAHLGPTDKYGNNLSNYFYTDGGYNLDYPGTYTTTGHIKIGNLSFSFPITIIVTGEIAEEYYYSDYDYSDYNDYSYDDYSDDDYGYDDYGDADYSYDDYSNDDYGYDDYSDDDYGYDNYSSDDYDYDGYDDNDYSYEEYNDYEYSGYGYDESADTNDNSEYNEWSDYSEYDNSEYDEWT